ncbi:MAG TPA: dihydrofolate reductase family protein [Micromonosporaceae bacterium]|jgi:dihydrofolate reductase
MGAIVAVEYLTLDGVMEEPRWSGPYFNEELQGFQLDNLMSADALLLGRVTYEGFKAAWPAMANDEAGFGRKMNGMPKYVATRTLTTPEWNATFLGDDVAGEVAAIKQTDQRLLINGSANLVNYLARNDLVDEYRLMVFPVVVGSGKHLFDAAGPQRDLTLTDTRTTESGVAILTYTPAR